MRSFPRAALPLVGSAVHLLLVAAPALRADVLRVDPAGLGDFTTLQPAVDAAGPDDLVLVRSGSYAAPTIQGKTVHLAADAGASVVLHGTLAVLDVGAGDEVRLQGLEVQGPAAGGIGAALRVAGSAGDVRVQGCRFVGGEGSSGNPDSEPGGRGVHVVASGRVSLLACELVGGTGGGHSFRVDQGGLGGDALLAEGSLVHVVDGALTGGAGGQADAADFGTGGAGGAACRVTGLGAVLVGSTLTAGVGGSGNPFGADGHALVVGPVTLVHRVDTTLEGAVQVDGSLFPHPVPLRRLSAPALAPAGAPLAVELEGLAGDQVWVASSAVAGFQVQAALGGVWLVRLPPKLTLAPQATISGPGAHGTHVPLPSAPAGRGWRAWVLQAVGVDAVGEPWLGEPRLVHLLDCAALEDDCDGDGVGDTCALLTGAASDCDKDGVLDACEPDCDADGLPDECALASGEPDHNGNGVPDGCEPGGVVWHVDPAAAPGGDGSPQAPLRTMGAAFARALSGHTVLLADGTYTGPDNRGLDFGGRDLVVRSANGPAGCVVDLGGANRAFSLQSGETRAARIEGITFRDGWASPSGGALRLWEASATVVDCVFEGCEATSSGGAILAVLSDLRLIDSRFVGCAAPDLAAVALSEGHFEVSGCHFEGNVSTGRSPVEVYSELSSRISHCTFVANRAHEGGALSLRGSGPVDVDHCLWVGNSAVSGGALHVAGKPVTLTNGTFARNSASVRAGVALVEFPASVTLRNSVLWGNGAPDGSQLRLTHAGALDVAWCDVEGGAAGVAAVPGATVTWGAGNLDLDPLFVLPDGPDGDPQTHGDGDWRLAAGSPCLDAGDNASVAADVFDLDGDLDVQEPVPLDLDLGPRFVDDPAPDTGSGAAPLVDLGPYER